MIYTLVLGLLFIVNSLSKKLGERRRKKIFFFCSFVILAFLSACRFQPGSRSDMYRNYMHVIRVSSLAWNEIIVLKADLLHDVLRKIVSVFFNDPQMYFFITAFFIVGVHLYTIKKYTDDVFLGVFLFYAVFGYFTANNITREYIAICFVMLAWKYIIERKPVKFFVFILIATGFHISALVAVPLFFLCRYRFSRNILYIYLLLGTVLVVFNKQLTTLIQYIMFDNYGEGYGSEGSNPLRLIWTLLGIVSVALLSRNTVFYRTEERVYNGALPETQDDFRYINFLCHGTVLYCFFSILSVAGMLLYSRVAAYFGFITAITIMYSIDCWTGKNRQIYRLIIFSLAILWFMIMNMNGKLIPTPYTPFWEYSWRYMIR